VVPSAVCVGSQSHRVETLGQRPPARDAPHAFSRPRSIGDAGEQSAQFDGSQELATLLVGGADRCGLCLGDDEHHQSMENMGRQRQVLRADFSDSPAFGLAGDRPGYRHCDLQELVRLQVWPARVPSSPRTEPSATNCPARSRADRSTTLTIHMSLSRLAVSGRRRLQAHPHASDRSHGFGVRLASLPSIRMLAVCRITELLDRDGGSRGGSPRYQTIVQRED
jgi:hypothetical protein